MSLLPGDGGTRCMAQGLVAGKIQESRGLLNWFLKTRVVTGKTREVFLYSLFRAPTLSFSACISHTTTPECPQRQPMLTGHQMLCSTAVYVSWPQGFSPPCWPTPMCAVCLGFSAWPWVGPACSCCFHDFFHLPIWQLHHSPLAHYF